MSDVDWWPLWTFAWQFTVTWFACWVLYRVTDVIMERRRKCGK